MEAAATALRHRVRGAGDSPPVPEWDRALADRMLADEARFEWDHGIAARKRDVWQGLRRERGRRVKLTSYGYYYSGGEGMTQVVTWTGQNLFKELMPEMETFLNGFVVTGKRG